MKDQPRRPAFFWLALLVCRVYAGFFAFTTYDVVKGPGWTIVATNTASVVSDADAAVAASGRIERGDRLPGDQWR